MASTSQPTAVVTGGTGFLGTAVCRRLFADGYRVFATAESEAAADRFRAEPGHREIVTRVVELTDGTAVDGLFAEIDGPVDALACLAGGWRGGPLAETTDDDLALLTRMNVTSAVVTLRAAYPYLRRAAAGAGVVLVSSRSALAGGAGSAVYAATKAGVAGLVYSLAAEWLEEAISINAIAPGILDTPANREAMPDADHDRWPSTEALAAVVTFLLGPQARVVSGAVVPVYGRS
ncbi:MAG: SDR family NAD(P)-dependent oxidoreductase [Nitrospirota bacterium]|jgi:NAD(P)-dependent dehydrogenase (short-subunit alcohol dehydrogenase family)